MKNIVYTKIYNEPKVNKREILRYLGCDINDKRTLGMLDDCIDEIGGELTYKVCYSRFPIFRDGDLIDLGFAKTTSHSLGICLNECDEIILFCATIGHRIDRVIEKYSISSPSRATIIQAIGSERVEALCDEFCADVSEAEAAFDREIRPRFSPGYGDLSLELQRDIFASLDPTAKIGISLNDSLFMRPSKSVSAIIGIKKEQKNEP